MTFPISLILLIVGIVLLIFGVNANDSIASHFSNLFTGHPTDRTVWLLVGGGVCTLVGLAGMLRPRPKSE